MISLDEVAVLIPCYNEEKTIEKVVKDFREELPQATIYVYDNNSTDATAPLARAAGARVYYEKTQGKGAVIRSMFRDIDARAYIIVDGDDTYPAHHAKDLLEPILTNQADMVIGDRLSSTYFQENERPFHNLGNTLVRFLINKLFQTNVKDIMTGYRAFSYEFVKTFPVLSEGFEIETEMTIHSLDKNLRIESIVIDYRDRPKGSESKLNTYSDGFKVLRTIGRLFKNYKPLGFFTILALILIIISFILFISVFREFLITHLVERFPTLIVAGFMALTAIILFITGVILDVNAQHERQDFEYKIKQVNLQRKVLEEWNDRDE